MRSEKGFTLIELLTVIVIIGILAGLGITSFGVYRSSAAYAVANKTIRDAQISMEAGLTNEDDPPPAVALTTQHVQGPVQDPNAAQLLPAMQLPRQTSFAVSYDPDCLDPGCESASLQVRHCQGDEFVRYVRYGDGAWDYLEHLAGTGCP